MSRPRARRKTAVNAVTALAVLTLLCASALAWRSEPRFFRLKQDASQATEQRPVLRFQADAEQRQHTLYLLYDKNGAPQLFYTDVTLIVCCDRVCDPVRIELYWDLLGNYAGYGVVPDYPLLKYDHKPFEPADYTKMHQILLDGDSLLGTRPLAEMYHVRVPSVELKSTKKVGEVDAVSGATTHEIRQAVVAGALYSCYAIWHLVHGDLREKMLAHTRTLHTPAMRQRFLNSDNADYQRHAIAEMDAASLDDNLPRILELYSTSNPLLQASVIEQLPQRAWANAETTKTIYSAFPSADAPVRLMLVEHLAQAHASAAELLVKQVPSMNKSLLKAYLKFLRDHPQRLTATVRGQLQRLAETEQYAYCYVISAFLDGVGSNTTN